MATSIAHVRVTPVEAGGGYLITCNQCPLFRLIRVFRGDADLAAVDHQRDHVGGTTITQHEAVS